MKPLLLERASVRGEALNGLVLSEEMRGDDGRPIFAKGHVIAEKDVTTLLGMSWSRLHLVALDDGEIHESVAGQRIAEAAAGEGIAVGKLSGGHWPLTATVRGILDVSLDAMRMVNTIDGPCVYSVFRGQVVDAGELVARAKITPFALDEARVCEAESVAQRAGGLVRVRPFRAMRIGAVVREALGEKGMTRFREALGEKVAWLGSELLEPRFVADDPDAIGRAIVGLIDDGAEIIALAGTKAMDLLDPAFAALNQIDAQIERHGVPAHPGSLFWLARRGDVPIIGMPTCGLFSQATVFDLVLPRMLTGERIGRAELADLGHGGLLTREMAFRFPPYRRSSDRGQVE
jgi:hypothetical protein